MNTQPIHELLKPLKFLIGRWRSIEATGFYPTIKQFRYCDEIQFESIGQPILNYLSQTWNPEDGSPMHSERGYLRIKPNTNQLAFMVAYGFGATTIEEGTVTNQEIKLKSVSAVSMSFVGTVNKLVAIERIMKIDANGQLVVHLLMSTEKNDLTSHLQAIYERIG